MGTSTLVAASGCEGTGTAAGAVRVVVDGEIDGDEAGKEEDMTDEDEVVEVAEEEAADAEISAGDPGPVGSSGVNGTTWGSSAGTATEVKQF